MMPGTPRTFVGPMVLLVEADDAIGDAADHAADHAAEEVRRRLCELPGIADCELDRLTDTLVVTAASPVDRTDVLRVLARAGWRVRR